MPESKNYNYLNDPTVVKNVKRAYNQLNPFRTNRIRNHQFGGEMSDDELGALTADTNMPPPPSMPRSSSGVGLSSTQRTTYKPLFLPPPPKFTQTRPKVTVRKVAAPIKLTPDTNLKSQTVVRVSSGVGLSTNPMSIFTPNEPQMAVVSSTAQPSKLSSIFGLASQIIAGFSRNPTVQTADGQVPIYPIPQQQQLAPYNPNQTIEEEEQDLRRRGGAGADVGNSLGQGFDGIIQWMSQNPLIVVGFAGGMYLLFKQPPGRR